MKNLFLLILFLISYNIYSQISSPILTEPPDEADIITLTPLLDWNDVQNATSYIIEISTNSDFTSSLNYTSVISEYQITSGVLAPFTIYYWRVCAVINGIPGDYSTFSFRTVGTPTQEMDYIKGIIQELEGSQQISFTQGNILINFLDHALNALNLEMYNKARAKLNAFKNHVNALINSNQISQVNGNDLINKANTVLILLGEENTLINTNNDFKTFYIKQNYPNPFNPETFIEYYIPENSIVSLKVYNTSGTEVNELVNKYHTEGTYIAKWNAAVYSSGIYFYRITIISEKGIFTDSKRMVLVK